MPATQTHPAAQTAPVVVPSVEFLWDPATRTYSAEASSLGWTVTPHRFTLLSRAGYAVPMVLARRETIEGDVMWWDFRPVHPADARAFAGVTVYND